MTELSSAQRRMWFIQQLGGTSATYNVPLVVTLDGELDVDALRRALADVVERHEPLRTVVRPATGDVPAGQVVLDAAPSAPRLPVLDVDTDGVEAARHTIATHVFDLARDVPVHGVLLRLGPRRHELVLAVHHAAIDGESLRPLAQDLATAYRARARDAAPGWEPLPVRYRDYSAWQAELLGDAADPASRLADHLGHWRAALDGAPTLLALPTDHPRPPVATGRGGVVDLPIPADVMDAVDALANARSASTAMVLHAALAVLLEHLGAGPDLLVGSTHAGRDDEALQDLVGFFVHTWVLRVQLHGHPTFVQLVDRVRAASLDAYDHVEAPFDLLVGALDPQRGAGHHPLFQVMLTVQNEDRLDLDLAGDLRAHLEAVSTHTAKFDLEFNIATDTRTGATRCVLEYATDLFDSSGAERIARGFVGALTALVADPARPVTTVEVPGVPAAGRAGQAGPVPSVTPVELISRQAAAAPGRPAVTVDGRTMTYGELLDRSRRIAGGLRARGIGSGSLVGLGVGRGVDLVPSLLGVWLAGAAYVPLDPAHPTARHRQIRADVALQALVVDASTAALFDGDLVTVEQLVASTALPEETVHPHELAYVMFTSGSTGRPKGVCVSHANIAACLPGLAAAAGIDAGETVLAGASVNFDVSVFELCTALTRGAHTLLVRDPLVLGEPGAALDATVLSAVPSVLARSLPAAAGRAPETRSVVLAGDALPGPLVADLRAAFPGVRIVNCYGQTETFYATTHVLDADEAPATAPIGGPLPGVHTCVLGSGLRPVPAGVVGELYVAGPNVGRGYLGDPAGTAQRFVADPYGGPGARMYRTGDLARVDGSGRLHFAGRADDQVKLNGLRMEPAEVERAILAHPGVAAAAVTVHRDGDAARLVGYAVPVTAGSSWIGAAGDGHAGAVDLTGGVGAAELRRFLADRLPEYLVPASIVVLDELPRDRNGKLDRRSLPEPEEPAGRYRAPATEVETLLCGLFADILGRDRVGVDDDFFALGGDSIRSIQLASRASGEGVRVSPREIFQHRTVAALAAIVDDVTVTADSLAELEGGGVGWMPLTPIARFLDALEAPTDRFSMSVVLDLPAGVDGPGLDAVLRAVVERHDGLRAGRVDDGLVVSATVDLRGVVHRVPWQGPWDAGWRERAVSELDAATGRLAPRAGRMLQAVWFDPGPQATGRLLLVVHHLVCDSVSWRILLPDLAEAWRAVAAGRAPRLAPVGTSLRRWAHALVTETPSRAAELPQWVATCTGPDPLLGHRALDPEVDVMATQRHRWVTAPAAVAEAVTVAAPRVLRAGVNDALLSCLALAVRRWRRERGAEEASLLVALEGHGREEQVAPGADLTRTVGWFTSLFPVRLDLAGVPDDAVAPGAAVRAVKERLAGIPDHGVGYGMLRYLDDAAGATLAALPTGRISFNYVGRHAAADMPAQLRAAGWSPAPGTSDLLAALDAAMPVLAELEIIALVTDSGELATRFAFPEGLLDAADVDRLAQLWGEALAELATHVADPDAGGLTPSDVALVSVGQAELDRWHVTYGRLADVWPLTSLQQGILFHSLLDTTVQDAYQMQFVLHLRGTIDAARMRRAGQALLDRHLTLRAAFAADSAGDLVQVIPERVTLPWREAGPGLAPEAVQRLLVEDRTTRFDLAAAPLLRMTLLHLDDGRSDLVLSTHHVSFDGWSVPVLIKELFHLYGTDGDPGELGRAHPYREFLAWVQQQDLEAALHAWTEEFAGVGQATLLAGGPRARAASGGEVSTVEVPLPRRTVRQLATRAAQLGITVNTAVQSAWGLTLSRLTGRREAVFGATVSGRPATLPGVDEIVGLFINSLPVRVDCRPDTELAELARDLQDRQAALLDHHWVGLPEIHRAVGLDALFDTLVVFESFPVDHVGLDEATAAAGLACDGLTPVTGTHYPLTVTVDVDPVLQVALQYQHEAFDAEQVHDIARRFALALTAFAEAPRTTVFEVDLLTPQERANAVAGRAPTSQDAAEAPGEEPIEALLAARLAEDPTAPALIVDGDTLSRGELAHRVTAVRDGLLRHGAGPDTVVALALPRTADLVVALLAVLEAGAGYLPLDPRFAGRRVESRLGAAGVHLVVTDADAPAGTVAMTVAQLAEPGAAVAPPVPPHPDAVAYLMFTSGSTGEPKAVTVPRRALSAAVPVLARRLGLPGGRVLAQASVNFDVSVAEILATLCAGGVVDLVPDVLALAGRDEWPADVLSSVPSAFAELLDRRPPNGARAVKVSFAGEALPAALVRRTRRLLPGVTVANGYGQTETLYATTHVLESTADVPAELPVGTPLPGVRVHVLGSGLEPVPPGASGEIYIAGSTLARGYAGAPAGTALRFVADPFGRPGDRMYRTGDLGRWNRAGELEYAGRADGQVKIRGVRVEPAEIEAVLLSHPSVTAAAVVDRELRSGGGRYLVGYVQTASGEVPGDLRATATAALPDAMVPSVLVGLTALPLLPSGKLDRAALPEPVVGGGVYRAPRSAVEAALCDLFAEVLDLPRVGVDDDFFLLGGHSLLATRLVNQIHAALDADVAIRQVFDTPTVALLAPHVAPGSTSRPSPHATVEVGDRVPLSFAQRRLWFLDRFEGPSATYNQGPVLRLRGPLDPVALEAALGDVARRHDALRTLILDDGGVPYQAVLAPADVQVPLRTVDLTTRPEELAAALAEEINRPFALDRDLPVRAALLRIAADEHVLALTVHHIAIDGESMGPLARDLGTAYRARLAGAEAELPSPELGYADYSRWQRDLLGDPADPASLAARQTAYWSGELAGLPAPVTVPTPHPRPKQSTHRGATLEFRMPAHLLAEVEELAGRHRATVPMVLQSALAVLLCRLGSGADIPIGSPIAGRTHTALNDLVGFFVNTWVLRVDLAGDPTFEDVLEQVRRRALAAYENQDVPFEQLVEHLNPERSTSFHPLFQVMFAWQNVAAGDFALDGLEVSVVPASTGTSKFDLFLNMGDIPGLGLVGYLEYATDLFDESAAHDFAARFLSVVEALVAGPGARVSAVDVTLPAERAFLVGTDRQVADDPGTLLDRVAVRVAQSPHAVAIALPDGSELSYEALDARARARAAGLAAHGVQPEDVVGVALKRGPELVVTLLAVLMSGAAYLPLDARHPTARLRSVLAAAGAVLVVTDDERVAPAASCPVLRPDAVGNGAGPLPAVRSANLAYVMATSGSTGEPKAVAMTHGTVARGLAHLTALAQLTPGTRVLAATAVTFDVSVLEIFGALTCGATVDLVTDIVAATEQQRWRGALVDAVPSVAAELLDPLVRHVEPATLMLAGEEFPAALAAELAKALPGTRLVNAYGQTESFYASTHVLSADGPSDDRPVPIGMPVTGTGARVLSTGLLPVPAGVTGELYVSGDLARGYHRSARLTAERFVADPSGRPGSRMYRTGDLATWERTDGLRFAGREDHQVKVHGMRIDTGEVVRRIESHPLVTRAVVRAAGSPARLVAHLTLRRPGADGADLARDVSGEGLRRFTAETLPDFMVPSAFVVLDAFPTDANGKLRADLLPEIESPTEPFRAPGTPTELRLATVIAEVLGAERIGLDDDFFGVGGDSIRSLQVVSRARAHGVRVSARDIFDQRTVGRLARLVDDRVAANGDAVEPADSTDTAYGWAPSLPMNEWLTQAGADGYAMALVLELPVGVRAELLEQIVTAVLDRHPALTAATRAGGLQLDRPGAARGTVIARVACAPSEDRWPAVLRAELATAVDGLDPAAGRMTAWTWFDAGAGQPGRLLAAVHHHVMDAVSWRIVLEDLAEAHRRLVAGEPVRLPAVPTSLRDWARGVQAVAHEAVVEDQLEHWRRTLVPGEPLLGSRPFDPARDRAATVVRHWVELPSGQTERLLAPRSGESTAHPNAVWLSALGRAVRSWRAGRGITEDSLLVRLEGHGREEHLVDGADLSRTVGWFTSMFPFRLDLAGAGSADEAYRRTVAELASVPDNGVGFGLLRYLNHGARARLEHLPLGQVSVNYLGRIGGHGSSAWMPCADTDELVGDALARAADLPATATLEVTVVVHDTADGPLAKAAFGAPAGLLDVAELEELAAAWRAALEELAAAPEVEPRSPGRTCARASGLQAGLLVESQLARGGHDAYRVVVGHRLRGVIDPERMHEAARTLVRRHGALRTVFTTAADGTVEQHVRAEAEPGWQVRDLRGVADAAAELARLHEAPDPVDTVDGPVVRFTLALLSEDEAELVLTAHHAVIDGWSLGILADEFVRLADPQADPLPSAPDYADYLEHLAAGDPAADRAAWSAELAGLTCATLVAGPGSPATRAATVPHAVPVTGADSQALQALAAGCGVTLNTVVNLAWALVLAELTGEDDVVLGSTVSTRPPDVTGIESMVGAFIATVPVRVRLRAHTSVRDALRDLHHRQGALVEHRDVSLVELCADAGMRALFDTATVFESVPGPAPTQGALRLIGVHTDGAAHFPIGVAAAAAPNLTVELHARPDVVGAGLADRAVTLLARALHELAAGPDRVVGALVLHTPQRPVGTDAACVQPRSVDDLFTRQVEKTPDAAAVVDGDTHLTYRELDDAVDGLAQALRVRGVRRGDVVGVVAHRCARLPQALLAVMRVGAAYLPLDAGLPARRVATVLADAGVRTVVSAEADRSGLETVDVVDPATAATPGTPGPAPTPDDAAYVIYTSGSTGVPKGVVVPHAGVAGLVEAHADALDLGPGATMLQLLSPGFDVSVCEMLTALCSGARLALAPDAELIPGAPLTATVARLGVTHLQLTPTMLGELAEDALPGVRALVVGGEVLVPALARRWSAGRRVVNVYGPTEATVVTTMSEPVADPTGQVPLGGPIAGRALRLLDARLRPAAGAPSPAELYVAGDCLARGYLGHPGATAARFVADPYGPPGSRMLRTGDQVRRSDDGDLLFVGRVDDQLKVRGMRIEPAEVEAALVEHPGCLQAAVVARGGGADRHLVAAVLVSPAPDGADPALPAGLRAHLADRLPPHLVPSVVFALDELPTTSSGKVDRLAVAAYAPKRETLGRQPANELEGTVRAAMTAVLDAGTELGVDDDFFEAGGHSLRAARLVSRLSEQLGVDVPLAAVFERPTAAGLAARIARLRPGVTHPADDRVVVLRAGSAPTREPLWFVHSGFGLCWPYLPLVAQLPDDRHLLGLQAAGFGVADTLPTSVADLVAEYVTLLRERQPAGPYHLTGYSVGATIAHAVAARLQADGDEVATLVLLDGVPAERLAAGEPPTAGALDDWFRARLAGEEQAAQRLARRSLAVVGNLTARLAGQLSPVVTGDVEFVHTTGTAADAWAAHVDGTVRSHRVATSHEELLDPGQLPLICRLLTGSVGPATER